MLSYKNKITIQDVADMAGVSTRTLRYYDQIGLLKPAFISDAGYRFYGKQEVDMLQQILFYRERGFDLKSIRRILMEEDFDLMGALEEHLRELKTQRAHMDALISLVHRSIMAMKGEERMDDPEKFQVFKEGIVRQHEEMYGAEARAKYGDGEVNAANASLMGLTREQYDVWNDLDAELRRRRAARVDYEIGVLFRYFRAARTRSFQPRALYVIACRYAVRAFENAAERPALGLGRAPPRGITFYPLFYLFRRRACERKLRPEHGKPHSGNIGMPVPRAEH